MTGNADWLKDLLADDDQGLLTPEVKPEPVTNADILANRFEEITTFIDEHSRNPDPANRDDINEFQLGHRLAAILDNSEYRDSLTHLDRHRLFDSNHGDTMADILASGDPLLGGGEDTDLFNLKHVPPTPKEAPDKVAQGRPCEDFDQFEQLFADCNADLRSGRRDLKPFRNPSNIREGAFYVQRGMLVYVAEIGELTQKSPGQDGRTRCIYSNGTESDLLLQSLARGLYDEGKIVTEPNEVTRKMFETPDHVKNGFVYVAVTHSKDKALAQFQHLHKIGYTSQTVKERMSTAEHQATFLHSKATAVDSYEMPATYAKFMETVLHQFFSAVRIDMWDDDGTSPNEWFDVPAEAVAEAIELIQNEQIAHYRYNADDQKIELG